MTPDQAYALALADHQAGRLPQAEARYRQILAAQPDHADSLHLLGVIEHQHGNHARAADLVTRSLALNPQNTSAHSNLGEIRKALGQWDAARACYERALALDPNFADAHHNLGTFHLRRHDFADAARCFERALALQPGKAESHHNLGLILGNQRLYAQARAHFERALSTAPNRSETHSSLGYILSMLDQPESSLAHLRRALELEPRSAEAHGYLASTLANILRFTEARAAAEQALALDPACPSALGALAFSLQELGQLDAALATYRRFVAGHPAYVAMHSNLLHSLLFHPATTAADLRAESALWNERHVAPLRARRLPHANDPDPARRLRVGYVSPDFRDHAISHFIAPLLAAHDRAAVEVHCYATGPRTDAVTARLQPLADRWHDVSQLTEEALAARVRADGIDILVDLSLHTSEHRLLTFALQPAPVQVSWLGYAGTSGVEGIGYRFTDRYLDPPSLVSPAETWSSEEPVRLPDSWCCYQPAPDAPEVGGLPALGAAAAGVVTFGSLNQMGKHHPTTLRLWLRLLAAVPHARLVIYNPDPAGQDATRAMFEAGGIAWSRLLFTTRMTKFDCLRVYNELVDIALDPIPHNGMTTTCEALWMGVPVVTLPGTLPVARTGLSLLTTVGLPELVARDEDDYLRLATELAHDLPRLATLRAGLRERMRTSPLMDALRFARHVETAYRAMWQQVGWRVRGLP